MEEREKLCRKEKATLLVLNFPTKWSSWYKLALLPQK